MIFTLWNVEMQRCCGFLGCNKTFAQVIPSHLEIYCKLLIVKTLATVSDHANRGKADVVFSEHVMHGNGSAVFKMFGKLICA